jgi:hypothetical protein
MEMLNPQAGIIVHILPKKIDVADVVIAHGEAQEKELAARAVYPDGAVNEVGVEKLRINLVVKIQKAFVGSLLCRAF